MPGKKADSVPAELVAQHIREWVGRYDGENYVGYELLAERSGLNKDYFYKLHSNTHEYDVSFDVADRMFCAMEIPNIWYCDDNLRALYEDKVQEADRLHPLAVAA